MPGPGRLRGDVLEAQAQLVVLQHPGHLAQPARVEREVLAIGERVRGGRQPGADPAGARPLQPAREARQLGEAAREGGVVLPEVHRQEAGPEDEALRLHLAEQVPNLGVGEPAQLPGVGKHRLEAVARGEVDGLGLRRLDPEVAADEVPGHAARAGPRGLGSHPPTQSGQKAARRHPGHESTPTARVHVAHLRFRRR